MTTAALSEVRTMPRRFVLLRHRDPSGVSGTGTVAEGVQFSDGWVTLHWPSKYPSSTVYESIDHVRELHGHDGSTVIRWLDPFPRCEDN